MAQGDKFQIPQFLQARTKEDLVRVMLLNNLAHGMEFNYFDIQKDGPNWVSWYRFPIDHKKLLVDQIRGASNG